MNVLAASFCCLLLAALAAGASLRISGGDAQEAEEGELPFQVALFKGGSYFCSGTILSATWVITAASCLDGVSDEVEVHAGLVDLTSTTSQVRKTVAADRTIHPQFDQLFLDNDVALIKLTEPLTFGDLIAAATLPTYAHAAKTLVGEKVLISGWGRTGDSTQNSQSLLSASVTLAANSVCEKAYGNKVIGTKMCLDTASQSSPCLGDAGGPVSESITRFRQYLYGIVSFGFEDGCTTGKPVVFTRVSSFLEWIGTVTGIPIKDN